MPADLLVIQMHTSRCYTVHLTEPGKVPVQLYVPDLGPFSEELLRFFEGIKTSMNDIYNFRQTK